jgi:mutator protein MutT
MNSPLRSIHVVAAVIVDARGRILLNRRTGNSDMAGLWEFPGGKREPGETSEQALARELHEELGIEAEVGEWVMEVPQLYPDKRLRLEVRMVRQWKGTARGREGQAITWVTPDKLGRYSMPPADLPVVAALRQPECYLVTPEPLHGDAAWLAGIEAAVASGIRRVQLRTPVAADRQALARSAVQRFGRDLELLVNRDIALAQELGVGVHLGGRVLPRPGAVAGRATAGVRLRGARPGTGHRDPPRCDAAGLGGVRTPARAGVIADLCDRRTGGGRRAGRAPAWRLGRGGDPFAVAGRAYSVIQKQLY